MKIHLTTNSEKILDNYLNLLPIVKQETDNVKQCDPLNLDKYVDNGECEEILIQDILACFPHNMIYYVLDKWLSKLSIGGKIIVVENDIDIIVNQYNNGMINSEEINKLLFGDKSIGIAKTSCFSMFTVKDFFENKGLKIMKVKIDGTEVIVEAQRNG